MEELLSEIRKNLIRICLEHIDYGDRALIRKDLLENLIKLESMVIGNNQEESKKQFSGEDLDEMYIELFNSFDVPTKEQVENLKTFEIIYTRDKNDSEKRIENEKIYDKYQKDHQNSGSLLELLYFDISKNKRKIKKKGE